MKIKLPLYKIYFLGLLTLIIGVLGATGSVYLQKELVKGQEGHLVKDDIEHQSKRKFAPPLASTDKDIVYIQTCFQDSTQFFSVTSEGVDRVTWDFGTGVATDTSNLRDPYFIYSSAGTYNVTLTYHKGADSLVLTKQVIISAPLSPLPDLGPDTAICPGVTYILNPKTTGDSYLWSTGATSPTISVKDSAGTYWVAVTAGTCTQLDEVEVTIYGQARRRAAIWHFGNEAGIDFNKEPPAALPNGKMNAPEGSATISDINGKLLFYTDGNAIFNKKHGAMKDSTGKTGGLGGDPTSTQSSIIIPWPDHPPYYFVFTTEAINSIGKRLTFSLVDMKGDGANGKVILKKDHLFERVTENLTAWGNEDGSVYWLITHEVGSATFLAYKITTNGIEKPPVASTIGSIHSAAEGEGYLKISTDGEKLAAAVGGNVELFHFNDSTGRVTNLRTPGPTPTPNPIKLSAANSGKVYGIEFSPDGSKLYVSQDNPGALYQYTLTDSVDAIMDSARIARTKYTLGTGGKFGALQIAPDNKIYMAVDFASDLAVINNPDGDTTRAEFQLAGFQLSPGKRSTLGLPNFVQSFIEPPPGPGFAYSDSCALSPIDFQGSGWGDRDQFAWTFGDGGTASGQMVQHTFSAPGSYIVAMTVTNDCPMDTIIYDTLTIIAAPAPVVMADRGTCPGGTATLDAGPKGPDQFYLWSTGDTTRTVTVPIGSYWVAVYNAGGCASLGQAQVYPTSPVVSLGPDRVLCFGNSTTLDAGNQGASYLWNPGGATTRSINVNAAGTYIVSVTDPLTNCVGGDTINITVSPKPLVNPIPFQQPSCGLNDGIINLDVAGDPTNYPSYTYEWRAPNGVIIPGSTNSKSSLGPGIYRVRITHPQGCDSTYTIPLNPSGPATIAVSPNPAQISCPANNVSINVNMTIAPATNYSLSVYNQTTNQLYLPTSIFATASTSFLVSDEGTYYITVTDLTPPNCVYSYQNIVVSASPSKPVLQDLGFPVSTCNASYTVNAQNNPTYTYTWQAVTPGTTSGVLNTFSLITQPLVGAPLPQTNRYILSISNAGCIKKDTIDVTFNSFSVKLVGDSVKCERGGAAILTPQITPTPPPADLRRYSYQWMKNGVILADNSNQLTVNDPPGTSTYTVTVRNPFTACQVTDNIPVVINPSPTDPLAAIDANGCAGDTITLDGGNPGATYTWTGPGVTTPNASSIDVIQAGIYGLTVDLGGCKSVFSKRVSFGAVATSELEDTLKFCGIRRESATLKGGPAQINLQYRWSFSGSSSFSEIGPSIVVQDSGYYYLEILNTSTGCSTFDTVHVKNECESLIYVPNAFTPNGVNSKLTIFNTDDVGKFAMTIFNRWGEIVLSTKDKEFAWDGKTAKGTDVPAGTYAYTITYYSTKGDTNRKLTQRGSVAVIR